MLDLAVRPPRNATGQPSFPRQVYNNNREKKNLLCDIDQYVPPKRTCSFQPRLTPADTNGSFPVQSNFGYKNNHRGSRVSRV